MAKSKWNQETAIRGALRRTFSRSPVIREVMFKVRREVPKYNKDGSVAKKPAVQYKCNVCGVWTGSTMVAVDHITPVISVDNGFTDWNEFVRRLFCDASNLQVICDDCHQRKTNGERMERQRKKDLAELAEISVNLSSLPLKDLKKNLKRFTSPKKHTDVQTLAKTLIEKAEKKRQV